MSELFTGLNFPDSHAEHGPASGPEYPGWHMQAHEDMPTTSRSWDNKACDARRGMSAINCVNKDHEKTFYH
jgi:hypothetical protein